MYIDRGDRLSNLSFSQPSDLLRDLDHDLGSDSGHTAHCSVALIDLHLHTKFRSNRQIGKKTFFVDGRTEDRRTTWRSGPKNPVINEFGLSPVPCEAVLKEPIKLVLQNDFR